MPALPTCEHLDMRIETLLAALRELEGLLARIQQAGTSLPSRSELDVIAGRHKPVLAKTLGPLRSTLIALRDSTGSSVTDRWDATMECARRLDALSAELLPVAEGALARAAGLDNGLCALGQRLLDDIGGKTVPWNRIVIPAAREETSNRLWVVGLPLLDSSPWYLPIMVHELGHFAATRLEDQYSQRLGEKLLDGSWRERPGVAADTLTALTYKHAQELFADVFAAYCAGPAFAAALMTRAVPVRAWDAGSDHPSWGARMLAVLRALGRLADLVPAVAQNLSWITGLVADEWQAARQAVGLAEIPAALGRTVDAFTDGAVEVMELTGSAALFRGEGVLETGEQLQDGISPDGRADMLTVLNAAWAERLRDRENITTIERALTGWRRASLGPPSADDGLDGRR
jgi:hypothetical protein